MLNDKDIQRIRTALESINLALYTTRSTMIPTPSVAQSLDAIAKNLEAINKSIEDNTVVLRQLNQNYVIVSDRGLQKTEK